MYEPIAKEADLAKPPARAFASRRRDSVSKRFAALKTAAQLFLEKGYRPTSLNDVARRLHITKPALYHYFHNKEEILLGCYRWGTAMEESYGNHGINSAPNLGVASPRR